MNTTAKSMRTYITTRDLRIMRRVHRWPAPRWIRVWMLLATRGGDGWLWYAMAAVILLFGGANRFAALGAMGVAAALSILVFLRVKKLTGRKRPCHIEPHCWATLLPPDQFSFPSGHTITAFAVATSICIFYPSLAAGVFFCAVSIGISRIVLGMHFLSDVLAGAVVGALLGYGSAMIFR